jgi:purine-binding chemotaxis protein CheW
MPAFIRGVINLRGKIIPVLDLRLRFGLAAVATTRVSCIVVAQIKTPRGETINMGLTVDGVEEVLSIAPGDIEETPKFGSQLDTDFVPRIAKIKGRVLALLDLDHLVLDASADSIEQTIPLP